MRRFALSMIVTFATQTMKTTRHVSNIYENQPLEAIFEARSRQNEASGTKVCPRMPQRYKIELLGCLLVTLGLQKDALGAHLGDPGAPKWCQGGYPPRDPHPPDRIQSKRRISGVGCSGKPIKHAKTRINQQLDILSPPRPPQAPQATPRNRQRRSKCRTGVFRTPFCTPLGRPDPRNIVFSLRKTDVFKKSHFSLVRCAKMTQDAPRHPETLPKRATDHSKTSQRRPKMSPRRPKGRPIRPKGCQRHPKGRPRPPKGRPRRPKTRPTGPKRCPRRQHDQIWPPKASQNGVPGSPWTPKHKCWAGGIPEGITIILCIYIYIYTSVLLCIYMHRGTWI